MRFGNVELGFCGMGRGEQRGLQLLGVRGAACGDGWIDGWTGGWMDGRTDG